MLGKATLVACAIALGAATAAYADGPQIYTQPISEQVPAGDAAQFKAFGPIPLTGQWQRSTDGGSTWQNDTADTASTNGYGTFTLDIPNTTTAMNGYEYRVLLTNSGGTTTSVAATLSVLPANAPIVSGVSPTTQLFAFFFPARITLTGVNLSGAQAVTFQLQGGGPIRTGKIQSDSATKIVVGAPLLPVGVYQVQVRTPIATSPAFWPPGGPVATDQLNLFTSATIAFPTAG